MNSWGGDRRQHRRAKLEAQAAKMREENALRKNRHDKAPDSQDDEEQLAAPAGKRRYLGDALPKAKAVQYNAEDLIWMNRGTRY
jgi:hypothetical protein